MPSIVPDVLRGDEERQLNSIPIISADSHAEEPYELFERLPRKYRERAPRVEEREDGVYVIQEGLRPIRQDIAAANLTEEDKRREFRANENVATGYGRESGTDIDLRLADLEEDGVSAEVIYPQGIFKILASPDPDYQLVFARLYNDWYAEIFGAHGDRFVVSAVVPLLDIPGAVEEAERVAKLGFCSISVPINIPARPYNRPDYEPFWSALEDLEIPVAFHVFTRGENHIPEDLGEENAYGADLIMISLGIAEAMNPLAMLTASGVLQRHPKLKFVLVECGIGWLAWFLGLLDEIHEKRHMWHSPKLELKPSEYFKRQGYATFGDDAIGLRNRDLTGVDCLMWGSDYPHDEGTFPHSREVIARTFKDLPEAETRKIVAENAARLYGFRLAGLN